MGYWNGYSGKPRLPTVAEMRHARERDNNKDLKKEMSNRCESDDDLISTS